MYHKTEIFTCDKCGVPVPRTAQDLQANITREEATALRAELEKQAEQHAPPMLKSMLGGVGNLIRMPNCITLHFCEGCLAEMMPDLAAWRRRAMEAYLERAQSQRDDTEEQVRR